MILKSRAIAGFAFTCYFILMATDGIFTRTLKLAFAESGYSYYRIEKETGIPHSSLSRFMDGKASLRLDKADELAAFLRVKVEKPAKGGRRG